MQDEVIHCDSFQNDSCIEIALNRKSIDEKEEARLRRKEIKEARETRSGVTEYFTVAPIRCHPIEIRYGRVLSEFFGEPSIQITVEAKDNNEPNNYISWISDKTETGFCVAVGNLHHTKPLTVKINYSVSPSSVIVKKSD